MVEDHPITKLKPENGIIRCYLVEPVFAKDAMGETAKGRNQAVAVELVTVGSAVLADVGGGGAEVGWEEQNRREEESESG